MGVYKQYTTEKRIKYRAEYLCEHCGAENVTDFTRSARSVYTDRGIVPDMNKRRNSAYQDLSNKIDHMVTRVEKACEKKKFASLFIECKCSNCNAVPTWAFHGWFWVLLNLLQLAGSFIGIFVLLFDLLALIDKKPVSFIPVLILFTPMVLYYTLRALVIQIKNHQTAKLNSRYYPVIRMDDSF